MKILEIVDHCMLRTVVDRRKTSFDRMADYILANDPTKMNDLVCIHCGCHNGLIDSKNSEIELFYCYKCKEENLRKKKEE